MGRGSPAPPRKIRGAGNLPLSRIQSKGPEKTEPCSRPAALGTGR
jgi:hypothetical protein